MSSLFKVAGFVLFSSLSLPSLYGQFNLGLKAGANLNTLQVEGYSTANSNVTYHMGVIGHLFLTQGLWGGLSLQPEILYSRKAASITFSDDLEGINDMVLHYAEVPLGLTYSYKLGPVMPYVSVMPYFGCLLKGESHLLGAAGSEQTPIVVAFRRIDYGLKIGGGIIVSGFQISGMYSKGYTNIAKEGAVTHSALVELSLGYFFM